MLRRSTKAKEGGQRRRTSDAEDDIRSRKRSKTPELMAEATGSGQDCARSASSMPSRYPTRLSRAKKPPPSTDNSLKPPPRATHVAGTRSVAQAAVAQPHDAEADTMAFRYPIRSRGLVPTSSGSSGAISADSPSVAGTGSTRQLATLQPAAQPPSISVPAPAYANRSRSSASSAILPATRLTSAANLVGVVTRSRAAVMDPLHAMIAAPSTATTASVQNAAAFPERSRAVVADRNTSSQASRSSAAATVSMRRRHGAGSQSSPTAVVAGRMTRRPRPLPQAPDQVSAADSKSESTRSAAAVRPRRILYHAPQSLDTNDIELFVEDAECSGLKKDKDEECAVCLLPFVMDKEDYSDNKTDQKMPPWKVEGDEDRVVKLKECKHIFHLPCIKDAVAHFKKCPMCRAPVGRPRGKMPSGTMTVHVSHQMHCTGHSDVGTLVIDYAIWNGTQMSYHDDPGVRYHGTWRKAFIPNNEEGRALLRRLQYAFRCGLTFSVGTSLTTGANSVVTWASIHHKTSPTSGPFGYPDEGYFYNCNEELDNLGVPGAAALVDGGGLDGEEEEDEFIEDEVRYSDKVFDSDF